MKNRIRITALLCVLALFLSACGGKSGGSSGSEAAPPETSPDVPAGEITWIEDSFYDLHYQHPDNMAECSFTPRDGADGVAYGLSDGEGRFYGFTLELTEYTPGLYDMLGDEGFLQLYFPDHWDEYAVTELGDRENGGEIARYNGNPVFGRGTEDLSGAAGDFQNAESMLEYLILDEGNNRSRVYIVSIYDCEADYPGTYDDFGFGFRKGLSFDSGAAKAGDLANEDNSLLEAEGTVFEPVELVMGNYPQYDIPSYYLTIAGAEFFRHDGKEAIRVIYDVKNGEASDEKMWQAYEYFELAAAQDGKELTKTWEYEAYEKDDGYDGTNPEVLIDMANYVYDNEYSNNRRCQMRSGCSVRTAEEFLCDWQGGPITMTITLPIYQMNQNFYDEDDPLMAELRENCVKEITFDPADMPCRVQDDDWLTPVPDPSWTAGFPEEGDVFADDPYHVGHIRLGDAEFVDVDGETHMKLHVTYTNNGTQEYSILQRLAIPVWMSGMADGVPHFWVMQDGVSLLTVETEETKQAQTRTLAPGETAEYTLEYIVRTGSPIEVEVNYTTEDGGRFDGKAAGKIYQP